jgi:hypothetical protein
VSGNSEVELMRVTRRNSATECQGRVSGCDKARGLSRDDQ